LPIEIRRIDYGDPRAVVIRAAMDTEMNALYEGFDDGLSEQTLADIDAALVVHPEEMVATVGAFDGEELVGHAALRPASIGAPNDALEVKRVIVLPEYRGQGISKRIMAELETIAIERDVSELVLQTGPRQLEAIALYEKLGYGLIANFGLYAPIPVFLCYGKQLTP
jgi:ribosomal protein S18 acetylase RimI-like enzyme